MFCKKKHPENHAKSTKLLGRWGEELAAAHYRKRGWNILGMGYRTRFGELDVICEKQGLIAFVEVKLRKDSRFSTAAEQVNAAKQRRLRATAEMWLSLYGEDRAARFDVVEIYAPEGAETKHPEIRILEDAFS